MVTWRDPDEAAEPAAAIVLEFAPVPVAPAMPQMEIPPGPEQVMSDASPNKPTESLEEKIEEKIEQKVEAKLEQKVEEKLDTKPVEEPPPEVSPAPNPEVAIPPPPPQEVQQETPKTAGAAASCAHDLRSAGDSGTDGGHSGCADAGPDSFPPIRTWCRRGKRRSWHCWSATNAIRRRRNRAANKESPRFSSASTGKGACSTSRVVRSSGADSLDEEALALLRRAQPFPPPPRELAGDHVDLTVPIRFNLK